MPTDETAAMEPPPDTSWVKTVEIKDYGKDEAKVTTACACPWTVPESFGHERVKGDYCPIGPMNLHHWHDWQDTQACVFCGWLR